MICMYDVCMQVLGISLVHTHSYSKTYIRTQTQALTNLPNEEQLGQQDPVGRLQGTDHTWKAQSVIDRDQHVRTARKLLKLG